MHKLTIYFEIQNLLQHHIVIHKYNLWPYSNSGNVNCFLVFVKLYVSVTYHFVISFLTNVFEQLKLFQTNVNEFMWK